MHKCPDTWRIHEIAHVTSTRKTNIAAISFKMITIFMREITDNHNIIHSNYKDQIHSPYDLNLFISKFDLKKNYNQRASKYWITVGKSCFVYQ